MSRIDDYTEDMVTFTALAKIYSSEYFCNARVAGIGEIFVQRNFSAIRYHTYHQEYIKTSSQYDARACVTLHCLRVDARRNAKQHKDRLRFYPYVPLRCILASCHEKIVKIRIFAHFVSSTQRKGLALYCELGLTLAY